MKLKRPFKFTILLSEEEHAALHEIATSLDLHASDWIRRQIHLARSPKKEKKS